MKLKLFVILLAIAVAWVAGRYVARGALGEGREEINRTFQLSPGASIDVKGINGPVEIETSNTDTAVVQILRTARSVNDLAHQKIVVEQTPTGLVVRGEKGGWSLWQRLWGRGEVRQKVMLKLPRQVELSTTGINGKVNIGEIDGSVRASGINGKIEVAQATGYAEISGVNGSVEVKIARLGERGIRVSGINGKVQLRFADDINADLSVNGLNGKVTVELPNVTPEDQQEQAKRSSYRARIGTGGTPISVSGVNGSVRLERA